jgi:hypothetical protein
MSDYKDWYMKELATTGGTSSEKAWNHQQKKIDELVSDLKDSANSQMKLFEENNNSQKKIDAVLDKINNEWSDYVELKDIASEIKELLK